MIPCKFFAQGFCKNGNSCNFVHDRRPIQNNDGFVNTVLPTIERVNNNSGFVARFNGENRSSLVCTFFLRGMCNKGDECRFTHPTTSATPQHPATITPSSYGAQEDTDCPEEQSDSRGRFPCKFATRPGGCQNSSCPYLHALDDQESGKDISQGFEGNEDEASIYRTAVL